MRTNYIPTVEFTSSLKVLNALLFISSFYINATAQVEYSYDNNGNRIANIHHGAVRHQNKDTTTVKVYPNPTIDQINVAIASFKNCGTETNSAQATATIYLTDGAGNLLVTQKTSTSPVMLNLSSYNAGEYYVRVVMCNEEYSYEIIKNNPPGVSKPVVPVRPVFGIPK